MNEETRVELQVLLKDAGEELFRSCGVPLALMDASPSPPLAEKVVTAFVAFTGEGLKGYASLVAPSTMLRSTHPAPRVGRPVLDGDVLDWAAELSNQLSGRIKHKLLPRGVILQLSTPIAVWGRELPSAHPSAEEVFCARFQLDRSELSVWLIWAGEVSTSTVDLQGEVPLQEGDLLLF